MNKIGILRLSPFFYRHIFGILVTRKLPNNLIRILNVKISCVVEGGITDFVMGSFRNDRAGFMFDESDFYICTNTNEVSNLHSIYGEIKIANVYWLLLSFSAFYVLLFSIFVASSIHTFIKYSLKSSVEPINLHTEQVHTEPVHTEPLHTEPRPQ